MSLLIPSADHRIRIPEETIHELVAQIAKQFRPKQIILFGSYAYGEPHPESDIDFLIIMATSLRETEQALLIRQYLKPLFALDILVYTPSHLKQRLDWGDSFLKEITDKGIIMYESLDA